MNLNMGDDRTVNSGPVYGGAKPDNLLGESSDLVESDLEWKSAIGNEINEVEDGTGVLVHLMDDAASYANGFGSNGNQGVIVEAQMKDNQQLEDMEIENSEHESQVKEVRIEKGQFHSHDLVWGKVRSHPWWPGQILDLSDASEKAKRYCKKDCFLVAYFGDQTFAWNKAPRIKPFQMHFSRMEKQNTTEAFCNAVECALEEVSRRVEFGLSCSCLSAEVHDKLKTQIVVNAGIRKESLTRSGRDECSSAASFLPVSLVKNMKAVAQYPLAGIDRLEFVIARAQLLAFSRWKGFHCLPEFKMFDGSLKDGTAILVTGERKYSEDSRFSEQLPLRKGKLDVQDGSRKHKAISHDGLSSSKKQRCLSILMPRSNTILSNGVGESEVKVGSGVKKRKVLDSVPHGSVRENENVSVSGKNSSEKVHDLQSTETSVFEGVEDSYWTDMIVQCNTEEQGLYEPEISKESGITTDMTETTLYSDQGLDSKQEADVINCESGEKSEGCVDEKCEEEYTPTAFILNFSDLESIPSESNLNKIFSRYGSLIESYTQVMKKSRRAKVVFKMRSDAEIAFSSSGKFRTFGPSLVSYRLKYLPPTQRKTSISAAKGRKKGAIFVEGNALDS